MEKKHSKYMYWLLALLFLCLVCISIAIWRFSLEQENRHVQRIVSNEQKNLAISIKKLIERDSIFLKTIGAQWKGINVMTESRWQENLMSYIAKRSEIRAITWVDKKGFSRWVVPYYQKSIQLNTQVGYEPRRKEALDLAKQKKSMAMSRMVNLLDGDKGIFVVFPLYRRGQFDGSIVGIFSIQGLFEPIIKSARKSGFAVLLRDKDELIYASDIKNLYRSQQWGGFTALHIFGHEWHLEVWPLPRLVQTIRSPVPMVLLVAGLLFSCFVTALLWLIYRLIHNSRIIRIRNSTLAELQKKNKIILDTAGEGICGLDAEGFITFVNRSAQRMLGYQADELIGRPVHELIFKELSPDSPYQKEECQIYLTLLRQQKYQVDDDVFLRKNNSPFPVEYISMPIVRNQKTLGAVVTFNDISQRLENEKKIRDKKNEVELIYQLTELLSEASSFEYALQQTVDLICERMMWDVGHVYLPSEKEDKKLISSDIWYVGKHIEIKEFQQASAATDFSPGLGLPGQVLKTMKPCWVHDISKDKNSPRAKLCKHFSLRTGIAFPIVVSGVVVAVLEFYSVDLIEERENLFDLFFVLSAQVSRVWQKRKIEQAVQERETKYRVLFETAAEIIVVIDTHGIVKECNEVIVKVLGYTVHEVVGNNVAMLMPEQFSVEHDDYIQRYLETGERHVIGIGKEVEGRHKNGNLVPMFLSVSEIVVKGEHQFVGMLRDISEQVAAKQQLETLAHYDYLTGLANRFYFDRELGKMLAREQRAQAKLALIYMDLDGFKKVNDTYGHHVGDLLLIEFANRLQQSIRVYDVLARLGGDEFALILQDVESIEAVNRVVEKIMDVMLPPCRLEGCTIKMIVSLGIAFYPEDAKTKDQLLICADKALYRAKSTSGSSFAFFGAGEK